MSHTTNKTLSQYQKSLNYIWDVGSLDWVVQTATGGGGGGDASAANQVIGNASLASIDSKTPASGQALAAASSPVVLTAAQLITLTPPTNVGYATSAKQDTGNASLASIDGKLTNPLPISGTVTANAGTNLNTSLLALESGGNLDFISAALDSIGGSDGTMGNVGVVAADPVYGEAERHPLTLTTAGKLVVTDASLTTILASGVKVNNAAGASAVNIQDGGNSLTIDGTLTGITNVVHVDDNAGSLTVDGSVAATITKVDLTPASPTAASVGVASAQVVASNANRKGLILVNTSTNRISLGFGAAAVLDSGITLYTGGSYSMGEFDFDLGAVNAIASGITSNLGIQEYST